MKKCRLKYQLIFMWLYVAAIYVPYCAIMLSRHDVGRISLSVLGWYTEGLHILIVYLGLTLPFVLYQLFFLNRHFAGNLKGVYAASAVCCVFMVAGGFIPLRWGQERYILINRLHEFVSIFSTIGLMLTILITLTLCVRKGKRQTLLYALCGIYPAALLAGFIVLYTSALFQLSATLSFLIILSCVNTAFARQESKQSGNPE